MSNLQIEINKRRIFGIISHPDAGKTTLTEKLLLFGGAIQKAGTVKRNKAEKTATSDFMEIEKQRGISVATSVMGFNYKDRKINILDTPGHKDFAEDTYRTLTAVDSVILVIDCVKGVEEQTRKLMSVCRMRHIPVMVFINKMDREGKDPFDLLEEIEKELNISTRPLSWPIGIGSTFAGVYHLYKKQLKLFSAENKMNIADDFIEVEDLSSIELERQLGDKAARKLRDEVELVEGVYEPFDLTLYRSGYLAPVFFGSAINNFGIEELLDTFVEIAPEPQARETDKRTVQPNEEKFTGFVFKIHANLDPNHRDRIAFCRVCSGKFERNKFYQHIRSNKKLKFASPTSFMADAKSLVEEAWPGDVIGLYDAGNFKIGDTLTEGETLKYLGIPSFSPEIFKELENMDPMKTKQLEKGITQLVDEGVAQLFTQNLGSRKFVGTVGELQFEVIKFRLLHEYGASCNFRAISFTKASWITSNDQNQMEKLMRSQANRIAFDKENRPVYLSNSKWDIDSTMREYPDVVFHETSEW
ncbi:MULTISPECIES: peptide chain release factor 3 [Olivibacter]|jgi:peptide chain release factor 3|uniref:Peptide chain release factor 3 n=2 Tax=Olivibacter TaxID=376469 RepID=A0ABV6HL88_9SPHI|nr:MULTISPECIES: peptide chain release factor 3 [Olivibacter]MCL4641337.1 peptide chain release factor 3 [Olivibacter sp. UJ_SKK_5.1]MDM8175385.1 peptide chain release factor 3 [Olivibacter sp. 47]MDX3913999.1 peptide chain release factor 3 [Pseudosphingobacterium sp.]QEL02146.1 peptide chain release factor 3 [Olivibacter sp. LS-1]